MRKFYVNVFVAFVSVFLLISTHSFAQLNPERTAFNRIEDGKWESANRLIRKTLNKDTTNIEAIYLLAKWFFSSNNPSFQIDSASYYSNRSIQRFDTLTIREKEKIQKFPIDSAVLQTLRKQIDSAAFERAKKINTEQAYLFFLSAFPNAEEVNDALELRDEVSFLNAMKINTYQSYQAYLNKYPESRRAKEAIERYEKLLFEDRTRDKRLASYKTFLKEYPSSPHALIAEKEIFEISTASGESKDFFNFLSEYPESNYKQFATDILFHVYKEREENLPSAFLSDSIKNVLQLEASYWLPFLKNGLFGFMDKNGIEVLAPQFKEVKEDYKCKPIKQDILFFEDGIYSRSGKKISNSAHIESIGFGFLEEADEDCTKLIHKSGRNIISDCFDEYEIVGNNFIATYKKDELSLYTLSGRLLPTKGISEIEEIEGLFILDRYGKKIINSINQLAALADGNPFQDELVFDDVSRIDKGLLKVRLGGMEGILTSDLKYTIPLGNYTLSKVSFGLIEKSVEGSRIIGLSSELENQLWSDVKFYRDWLVLSLEDQLKLFSISLKKVVESNVDSIWFDQSLTYIQNADKRKVYLSSTHAIDLTPDSKINFIPSRDSVQFIYNDSRKKHIVFSLAKGEQLFSTEYELVESLGTDFFIVAKGSRKGVIGRNGKILVPIEMDIIVQSNDEYLSLLKAKKFGLFDISSKKYIKPVYERNVVLLDKKNLVVYKDGNYGLITPDAKSITEYEFKEVISWSDSIVWVKKDAYWMLLNYYSKKAIVDRVRDFSWIKDINNEKIVRLHRDNYYGIVNNKLGLIIPPTFTEIRNIGTTDEPLYFTEKYVEEAGIYVVVYYNQEGTLIRKQVYEEEEYERILCYDH